MYIYIPAVVFGGETGGVGTGGGSLTAGAGGGDGNLTGGGGGVTWVGGYGLVGGIGTGDVGEDPLTGGGGLDILPCGKAPGAVLLSPFCQQKKNNELAYFGELCFNLFLATYESSS